MSDNSTHDPDMKGFLIKLLSYKTTDDRPDELTKAIDFVEEQFKSTKYNLDRVSKNGYSSIIISTNGNKHAKAILSGHIDVVPTNSLENFEATESNGRIYARGAADMKGPVSAMIFALLELENDDEFFKNDISLILTSDEEIGGYFGTDYILRELDYRGEVAFLPDGGDNWHLCTDEKGVLQLQVTVRGKAAHGSRPWKGENSILKHMDMFTELKRRINDKWGLTDDGKDWLTTINLGKLNGGLNANSVPEVSNSLIDIRYPSDVDGDELLQLFMEVAGDYSAEVVIKIAGHATHIDSSNYFLKKWEKSVKSVRRYRLSHMRSEGASDARHFAKYNIPSIISLPTCSPGHIEDEWVDFNDLVIFKDTIKDWLLKL